MSINFRIMLVLYRLNCDLSSGIEMCRLLSSDVMLLSLRMLKAVLFGSVS